MSSVALADLAFRTRAGGSAPRRRRRSRGSRPLGTAVGFGPRREAPLPSGETPSLPHGEAGITLLQSLLI